MRVAILVGCLLGLAIAIFAGRVYWKYLQLFPKESSEIVQLTPEKRLILRRLKNEDKFQPDKFYTGVETSEEKVKAVNAVDGVIDAILVKPDGPIQARMVIMLIRNGMKQVWLLATEDRDRTQGYMLEIWYCLGFKEATGLFAYGSAFPLPSGYGEPLPPGWIAPDKPRLIK